MQLKTGKIVGVKGKKSWSQVHVFVPEGEKLKSHGQLMAALSFKALKEEVEVSSFGTEIITRLQEMYFSNEAESIYKKVEQTLESLAAEFMTEVELKVVVAVVWQKEKAAVLYAGRQGGGQVFLKRKDDLVPLLSEDGEGAKVVSGKLEDKDRVVVGTGQFFKLVPEGVLKGNLGQEKLEEVVDGLAPIVHGHTKNSRSAAVVTEIEGVEKKAEESLQQEEVKQMPSEEDKRDEPIRESGKQKMTSKVKEAAAGLLEGIKKAINKETRGEVFVHRRGKGQKSAATVAIVLVAVFAVSLVVAGSKRQREKKRAEYQAVVEEVNYKYEEAKSLVELNPLRARSLLEESKARLDEYSQAHEGELGSELQELSKKIDEVLNNVQKEYKEESATEWFDFNLVKEGFRGSDWNQEENIVWVWDKDSSSVVEINLQTKASKVIAAGDELKGGELVALAGKRGFVVGGGAIEVVDEAEGEIVAEVGGEDWGKIADAVGFSSNLYLLDQNSQGQIYKFLGVNDGLSSQRDYLKGDAYDLSGAVSMAIDGSVWVLFDEGTVVKYVRGEKDAFAVSGLDKSFERPVKIFTSPEVEQIYILDQQQTRVVVLNKNGEYRSQYVWPGMAGVKDLIVSEEQKKIFLLTGEKVFTLDLKD